MDDRWTDELESWIPPPLCCEGLGLVNSLGLPFAIWCGNARPAFPEVAIWQPPLAAHIWRAPPHGDKNIGATHRDVTSNILHSYLLTSQKSVLFPFYHPIKMKLTSVVRWNRKHYPDLTWPILHKLTEINRSLVTIHTEWNGEIFMVEMLFLQ